MKIAALHAGPVTAVSSEGSAAWWDKEWRTGFFKQPVHSEVRVERLGLEGDEQADLENHGGPDKAICVYPAAHYSGWRESLGLSELPLGAFGENFTVEGMAENEVCIGDVFQAGEAVFQISQPRQPCWKLARRWRIKDLAAHVERTGKTGWYFRVVKGGVIVPGAELVLVGRPHPEWSVAAANEVMHQRKKDGEAAALLAGCAALSASWKGSLQRRAASLEE